MKRIKRVTLLLLAALTAAGSAAEDRTPVKITSGLSDWQIVPREQDGFAEVKIEGTWLGSAHDACDVYVRVVRETDHSPVCRALDWHAVETATNGTWRAALRIPSGGLYRLETLRRKRGLRLDWNSKGEGVSHFGVGDVWVIAGQSNADGNGRAPAFDPPEEGVHVFRHCGAWGLASHPLHDGTRSKYASDYMTANHSPWLAFAKKVHARTGVPIGLVPAALGGSGIASWLPEKKGELFRAMERITDDACARRVKGVLWYQGCTDTLTPEGTNYYPHLASFIRQVRATFRNPELPILSVQINRVSNHPAGFWTPPRWDVIREAQRQATRAFKNHWLVSSMDCTFDDCIHNSSESNVLLGRRVADLALGKVYGQDIDCLCPDARSAVRSADGKSVTLSFDNVTGEMVFEPRDPALFPFLLTDEEGVVPLKGVESKVNATLVLQLERPLKGAAKLVGCPGTCPFIGVPHDMPGYRPMLAFTLAVTAGAFADFNVRDYGGSVAKAAEAAGKAGGGRVVVPAGEWTSGTIWLGSHVELHLEKGAVIKGSTKRADYNADDVFPENFHSVGEEWSGAHLVLAYKAEDVAITGEGVIDGNGPAFFGETQEEGWGPWYKYGIKLHPTDREWYRPGPMIAMFQTKNIRLEGVTLRNTPCWTAHFRCCDGLVAKGVTIDADREIANSDGFSIDCTRNVEVTGCTVRTGDDGFAIRASCKHHATTNLCENIRISDCDVSSCCFGIRFGVGTGTIRNVRVENCRFRESGCGIGFTPAWTDSGKNVYIEDIAVSDSHIGECERPVDAPAGPGDARVRNVRFANCTLEGLLPSRVQKSAKWQPENFVFENCSYHMIRRLKVRMNREWLARHYKNRPRTFLSDSNADVKLVKCTSDEPTESGVLLLTFDDRNFDDWEKALPLFAKYKAHATFFVCGEIDNRAVRTMKRLSEAGHSVGLHGLKHADAATLVDQLGGEAYWRQEVWPQLEKAGVSYLSTWNFAYPNCYRSEQSDALFKSKGVLHVRGGVKGATPYDPTGAKQKDRKPLVTNEAVYFPSKDLPNRHLINSILVGESYHTDIDEICACLKRVAERKEVICITSHGIRPDAKSINMKTAWLEKILSTAQELKLPVLGYDELPRPCGL